MDIDEVKDKVSNICQSLGGGLPYCPESIEAEDWDALATELADIARHACTEANRIASYAGIARRKANREQ